MNQDFGPLRTLYRILISTFLLGAQSVQAGPYSSMYSQAVLENAARIYSPNLLGIWLEDLQGELTPQERQVAAATALQLPLVGVQGHPFEFYADSARRRVFIPIFSVKFLDDLAISVAWLDRQGCDTQVAFDYVSMLRYQSPNTLPGGRFPPPRQALGVPQDVLLDPVVDDVSQKALKSAVYFLMAHELAHVLYKHRGYDSLTVAEAQRQENEADAFALRVMQRIAVPPLGMVIFFSAVSRIDPVPADFTSVAEYQTHLRQLQTHPLSPERLLAISTYIKQNAAAFTRIQPNPSAFLPRVKQAAADIKQLAGLLADPQVRALQRNQGLHRSFDDLRRTCAR